MAVTLDSMPAYTQPTNQVTEHGPEQSQHEPQVKLRQPARSMRMPCCHWEPSTPESMQQAAATVRPVLLRKHRHVRRHRRPLQQQPCTQHGLTRNWKLFAVQSSVAEILRCGGAMSRRDI